MLRFIHLDAEYPFNTEDLIFHDIQGYGFSDKLVTNPHTKRAFNHDKNKELYPIPADEILKNPALTQDDQNPGY